MEQPGIVAIWCILKLVEISTAILRFFGGVAAVAAVKCDMGREVGEEASYKSEHNELSVPIRHGHDMVMI